MSKMKVNRIENTSTTAGGIDINTSGNVGIGTSSPSDTLHLNDSVGYGLKITDSSSHIAVYRTHIDGAILKTASNHPLLFGTNDTERMRIDSSGRLLVGTTTDSGSQLLQVIGGSSATADVFIGNSVASTGQTAKITFAPANSIAGAQIISTAEEDFSTGANRTARLAFATRLNGNLDERLRIDSSGNVGIGTTSPEYLFDARGSINISGSIFRRGADNATFSLTNRAAQPLTFGTNDTERMRINSNGRVDIGDQLGVAHAGEFQVINTSGGQQDNDALAFFETNSPDWIMMTNYNAGGTHYHMRFEQQGSVRGSISGSSGAGVTYGGSSDYRLKENVVEITGTQGIDICKKLKPSYFNWINNRVETGETNTVDGFIAHEVQEAGVLAAVIGEKDAVNEDGSIDAQIMDYGKMTPVLSAAIKGLIDKIETLEQRLTDAGL